MPSIHRLLSLNPGVVWLDQRGREPSHSYTAYSCWDREILVTEVGWRYTAIGRYDASSKVVSKTGDWSDEGRRAAREVGAWELDDAWDTDRVILKMRVMGMPGGASFIHDLETDSAARYPNMDPELRRLLGLPDK